MRKKKKKKKKKKKDIKYLCRLDGIKKSIIKKKSLMRLEKIIEIK